MNMSEESKSSMTGSLKSAFESGFSNAASSLSRMINDKVCFKNYYSDFHTLESDQFSSIDLTNHNGSSVLITTEIFGDITGKSYLLISEKEFDLLTHGIPKGTDPTVCLKEEFTKELDNILSASVITRLSNELSRKMYGDIPILVGKVSGSIVDIIYDDFSEQTEMVYVNSIYFDFEKQPGVNPVFIWVVDAGSLRVLEPRSIT